MINEVIHIGLTVSDLDRSIAFYRDILGLNFIGEILMSGKECDLLFARENADARVAYLNGSDEVMAPPIELIQFTKQEISKDEANLFKTSISEICFKVVDINKTYDRLTKLGVEFISKPQYFDFSKYGFSKSKAVYLKDPDGIILELIEVLD